jgi:hypothetical protein
MLSKLKKLDWNTKTIDGVNNRTLIGSLLTFLTFFIIIYLIISEIYIYVEKDMVNRMTLDKTIGIGAIEISFNIDFHQTDCDRIQFFQEVTRGIMHSHEPDQIAKSPIDSAKGCNIVGKITTDKVAGDFRFQISKNGDFLDVSHTIHQVEFLNIDNDNSLGRVPDTQLVGLNDKMEKIENKKLEMSTGIYQYIIQIVSTHYTTIEKKTQKGNQIYFTERNVPMLHADMGITLSGQFYKGFFGLMFNYDFSPVKELPQFSLLLVSY